MTTSKTDYTDFGPEFLKTGSTLSKDLLSIIQNGSSVSKLSTLVQKVLELIDEAEKISKREYHGLFDKILCKKDFDIIKYDIYKIRIRELISLTSTVYQDVVLLKKEVSDNLKVVEAQLVELKEYVDKANHIMDQENCDPQDVLILSRRADTMRLIHLSMTYNVEQIKLSTQSIDQSLLRYRELHDLLYAVNNPTLR